MIALLLLGRSNEVAKVRSIVIELATATTGSFQFSIRVCDITTHFTMNLLTVFRCNYHELAHNILRAFSAWHSITLSAVFSAVYLHHWVSRIMPEITPLQGLWSPRFHSGIHRSLIGSSVLSSIVGKKEPRSVSLLSSGRVPA